MPHYQALSRQQHQYAGVQPQSTFNFAAHQAVIPVLAEEVPHLLPTMALVFVPAQAEPAAHFQLMGLQSFLPDDNLYLHPDGRWLGGYQPAAYRGHPFKLLPEESSDRLVLCVQTDSPAFHEQSEEGDHSLFGADGQPSELVSNVLEFLRQVHQGQQMTSKAVDQLAQAGLLEPWKLNVQATAGEQDMGQTQLQGLYRINEDKLKQLSGAELENLARSGALSLAYSQLLSTHRLTGLARLYDLRQKIQQQLAPQQEVDLDRVFGAEEDVFKF
ncbi:SapC family protein [Marinospirillum sp. MEB164]|uniref:SapC family protein n=1 Tax=Marinospirillum alkalitolerans TaxID=3123374 RepID=A0ABW8PUV8_9GAMM